jgi:hypothetical protein
MGFQVQQTQHYSTQGQENEKVTDVIKIMKQKPSSTNSERYLKNDT